MLTAYRCGPFVDLCRGPHVANTRQARALELFGGSEAIWRSSGEADDPGTDGDIRLQRVSGIAASSSENLKLWISRRAELETRSHRTIGSTQGLFMTHASSPGGPFFLPHGLRIVQALKSMLRKEYRSQGMGDCS